MSNSKYSTVEVISLVIDPHTGHFGLHVKCGWDGLVYSLPATRMSLSKIPEGAVEVFPGRVVAIVRQPIESFKHLSDDNHPAQLRAVSPEWFAVMAHTRAKIFCTDSRVVIRSLYAKVDHAALGLPEISSFPEHVKDVFDAQVAHAEVLKDIENAFGTSVWK